MWEVVLGVEVHAQIISKTKLFSSAPTSFAANPNSMVSPVDAAFPGMLPVLNEFCVTQAVKTGLGLKAKINHISSFDRKNYFYADLPSGYQITQFYHPIVGEGHLDIDLENDQSKRVRINRIHLEQDAGKSTHDLDPTSSFIDLNRAGTALMEIVTHPDMSSAEEVMAFIKKLRLLLQYLGTNDGNMEEGSLRADINVSVRRPGEPLGTRVEIKNINSIRFIGQAIGYETKRQITLIEEGGAVIQETRLYDAQKGETRSMRTKEDAQDYRYFPEPDLLPLVLTSIQIDEIRLSLPELPDDKRRRLMEEYGIPLYDATVLVEDIEASYFFEETVQCVGGHAKMVANWMLTEVFGMLKGAGIKKTRVTPGQLAELIKLIKEGVISGRLAKEIFIEMWETGHAPQKIIDEKGLTQIHDISILEGVIAKILRESLSMVEQYKSGKDKLFGFFVGQVMKETEGKANPALVNEMLKKALA